MQQTFGVNMNTILEQLSREDEAFQALGLTWNQSVYMLGDLDKKNKSAADSLGAMVSMSEKHAKAHGESIQQYVAGELATIQHYHDIGRTDLANAEALAALERVGGKMRRISLPRG